jgi:tellurite resistance protein
MTDPRARTDAEAATYRERMDIAERHRQFAGQPFLADLAALMEEEIESLDEQLRRCESKKQRRRLIGRRELLEELTSGRYYSRARNRAVRRVLAVAVAIAEARLLADRADAESADRGSED